MSLWELGQAPRGRLRPTAHSTANRGTREGELGHPECPDQAELESLAALKASDYFVVDGDGTVWKNGPKPPNDLLDRTYSRVVSFNLAM